MDNAFNSFAFNIFRILSENNNDNTLISPYSILTSLNSCLLGAHNETSKEIFEALKYDLSFSSTDEVHDFMQKINEQWIAKDNPFTLYLANCLLVNNENDCEMDNDFDRKVNEIYGGIVREVDFTNEPESVIESCNEWIAEKTNNLIASIIDQLSPSAKLVLLNAIYFKGNWKTEFHSSLTENQPFYNFGDKSKPVSVPMMFKEELGCRVYTVNIEDEELRMLELPYQGNLSMSLLLTKSIDGLHKILSKISISVLEDMELLSHKADLWLPKFKLKSDYELKEALNVLGIEEAFTERADFTGITKNNVFMSNVSHTAVIEVDEQGTETPAAASAIEMILSCSMPLAITQFRVDHPFAFFIKDVTNGIILFVGKILSF